MSSAPIAHFTTNDKVGSVVETVLPCTDLWAMGQQSATRRLCQEKPCFLTGTRKLTLVSNFSARAARIAATYARFYLEQEEGCDPALKGRFYWMGLAAFASKQVKCGLDFIPNEPALTVTPPAVQPPLRIGKNALGKGNFWLFQDIFVWHWFYVRYPSQFAQCAPERNASSFREEARKNVACLPWAEEALEKLNNFGPTLEILRAFTLMAQLQQTTEKQERLKLQYGSLMAIANHEQLSILQPLIYNDWSFARTLDAQVAMEVLPFVPKRVAAFVVACDTEDPELRVQMTAGDLYDAQDRMKFITAVAKTYHELMNSKKGHMENEISQIATWQHAT